MAMSNIHSFRTQSLAAWQGGVMWSQVHCLRKEVCAGAYGGRKTMSRAFRSRFLELHVGDIPDGELAAILHQRCAIAPSHANKLVDVMRDLQRRRQVWQASPRTILPLCCCTTRPRTLSGCLKQMAPGASKLAEERGGLPLQGSNVFAGKHGLITPRDLFKWANRAAVSYQELAENGFLLLGERLRAADERSTVQAVLESTMKVKVNTTYNFWSQSAGRCKWSTEMQTCCFKSTCMF